MKPVITLTFDDGLPVQIEHALPELDSRGIKGTFFVIQKSPFDPVFRSQVWADATKNGHEIGAHSVSHRKPDDISHSEQCSEVIDCKAFIEHEVSAPVTSYAYPYTHVNGTVRKAASRTYLQARGGRVAREDKFITPNDGVDMFNLPCFHVGKKTVEEVGGWADEAIRRGAWVILMLHGVGPDETQWDNIQREAFANMLDVLQAKPIRIATMNEAALELRRAS